MADHDIPTAPPSQAVGPLLAALFGAVATHVAVAVVVLTMFATEPVAFGTASEVLLDGGHTGVYRLAVRTELHTPGTEEAARVVRSDYSGALTDDQRSTQARGWEAACLALRHLEAIGDEDARRCLDEERRPAVGVSSQTTGPSAGLAEALAAATRHVELLDGTFTVAATGELRWSTWADPRTGAPVAVAEVHPIGGVRHKAAAAAAAGVDVLVVPAGNAEEFAAHLPAGGPELVAVTTVHDAIFEVCWRTTTADCATMANS